MEILGLVLGILGNVLTLLVFASPLPTFWRIIKMRSTQSFSPVPYITTLLSNSLWLYYGLLKPNETLLVSISAVGVFFGILYIFIYLILASKPQRVTVTKLLLVVGVFFGTVLFTTLRFAHGNVRIVVVGIFCAANSACMYASPLSVMRVVIKTKSVEYMPFWLSFFLALSAGVWLAYALVIKDLFLVASNSIGSVFGVLQLSLYTYYSKKKGLQYLQHCDSTKKTACCTDLHHCDSTKKTACCTDLPYMDGLKVVDHEIGLQGSSIPLK